MPPDNGWQFHPGVEAQEDEAMQKSESQRDSFVIRVWREEEEPYWRGWVQHARSGECAPVHSLEELQEFIERWTGSLNRPSKEGLK